MKKYKWFSLFGLIGATLSAQSFVTSTDSESFAQLLDEHWQTANQEQIFFRKDPDAFRMNGKLPDMSKKGLERREKYNQQLLERLATIDLNKLTDEQQVTYRLFKYERQTEAKSYQQLDYFYPLNYYSGFDSYFAGAPANMSFLTPEDYQKYLISLADFPRYNQEHIDALSEAVSQGHVHYCESFKNYHKGIKNTLLMT